MAETTQQYFCFENNVLTIRGVKQVVEIGEKQAVLKLNGNILTVKGSGLNVAKLDREQGTIVLEVSSLASLGYKQSGLSLKGLFR